MGDGRAKIETTADVSSPEVVGGSDIGVRLTIKNLGDNPVTNVRVEPVISNELELRKAPSPIKVLAVGQEPSVEITLRTRKRWFYMPVTHKVDFNVIADEGTVSVASVLLTPTTPLRATLLGAVSGVVVGLIAWQLISHRGPFLTFVQDVRFFLEGNPGLNGYPVDLVFPLMFGAVNFVAITFIAVILAVVFRSGSLVAPFSGISVVGWRGAFVVGFLTPWVGAATIDTLLGGLTGAN